jgi:hypothetical protein
VSEEQTDKVEKLLVGLRVARVRVSAIVGPQAVLGERLYRTHVGAGRDSSHPYEPEQNLKIGTVAQRAKRNAA